jgi:hypothetical protein
MQAISLESQPTMEVNIHNQCSNFKLTNQRYFNDFISWNKYADVEVDAGSVTNAALTSFQAEFEGGLMYQLQRKHVKYGDQLKSTCTLLLVSWKSEGYNELRMLVQLIECDETFHWYKIRPKEYYQRYTNQLCTCTDPIRYTWLMHDGTVLKTRLKSDFTKRDGVLNITILEGAKDEDTRRPAWINPER